MLVSENLDEVANYNVKGHPVRPGSCSGMDDDSMDINLQSELVRVVLSVLLMRVRSGCTVRPDETRRELAAMYVDLRDLLCRAVAIS